MSKLCTLIILIFLISGLAFAQGKQTTLWEKSAAQGTLPGWFDTGNNTRGLSYGQVGGNDRLYVVSRFNGNFIYILDAANGDSLGRLDNRGLTGGTLVINDVGVSDDGLIYVCNLAVGGTFKVYAYTSEVDSPEVVISYDATGVRLGDKLTVKGSAADNTLQIWAASASAPNTSTKPVLVKFTTADNGATFTPTTVDVDVTGATGYGSAHADPLPSGDFYWNSGGQNPKKFAADGTLIGTVPGTVVATGSNAIAFMTNRFADDVFATYAFGSGNENARLVFVPNGVPADAKIYSITPTLGTNTNANGTGDVSIQNKGNGIYVLYVLSTNNGFGAYEINTNYFAGDFYIPQGLNPQGFPTLNNAVTELNSGLVTGTVNLILDADTLRENTFTFNADLSVDNNVVVKPAPGRDVTLSVTASPSVGNGPFMIGFNRGYVTFDGSNDGTDSRNLTVTTEQLSPTVDVPFSLNNANADNVVLKNLIIKNIVNGQTNFRYGAVINDLGGVMGFRVENCQIGTAERPVRRDGLAPWGGGAIANQFSFVNNEIYCGTRGVTTFYLEDSEVIGNKIMVTPTTAGNTNNFTHGIYITGLTGTLNIHENTIEILEKANVANTYLMGIAFAGNDSEESDIISIVNNMIVVGAADETGSTYGIGLRSANHMGNLKVYHNTVVVNDNASTLASHVVGNHTNGTGPVNIEMMNNIVINNHSGNTGSSAIGLIPATSMLTSDYNLLLANQNLVNYQGTLYADLAAWKATSQDANSISKPVNFVSATDLHLTGASVGDFDLAGTPLAQVTTDIDGNARSASYPYMGADEAAVELMPPMILTIAEARIDANGDFRPDLLGDTVTVRGYINSPNYRTTGTQYYMQDETAGIQVYGGTTMTLNWNFGDEILVTGRLWQFRGSTEIDQFTADAVTVLSTGNEIIPRKVKIADLGEEIESQLVRIDSVWMINPAQWPAEGSNGNVYITDGVDTTYIFIDLDTDLDGWTPPTGPSGLFSVIAVADQYTSSASVYDDGYSLRGTFREHFIAVGPPPPPPLPLFEGFTDGTLDLDWVIHPVAAGGTVEIADSTGSAWGSHVGVYTDSAFTGLLYVKDALYQDYTIEADFYVVGDPDPDFPLYMGLGIKMASEEFQFYRLVFRNSTASDNGQIRLQGYDGASWHINKYWNPGVDFEPLQTGWHNFKVTVIGNEFWAYINGKELPGCPYSDAAPFLTEGYPGIYVYNTALGRVIFDNFQVTEPTFPPPPEPLDLVPVWSLTQAAGTFPKYMSTGNFERGMAYGKVNGQDRVYVVTRNGIHRTVIHDAFSGDSLGVIPKPAAAEGVGLFHLNAVDVSDDGKIFVCNMTLNNDATNPFRVYRWDSETAEPQTVISYDAGIGRLGDMFSVHGSASDNSLVIWAGLSQNNRVVKFTTTDNGLTFTPEIITLPENSGTVPNVAQVDNETFWLKSFGRKATLYNNSGAVLDTVSGAVLGTGASKIKYHENNHGKFLMAYYPNVSGASGFERIDIIDVTNGGPKAYLIARTPSIGSVTNGNGVGSIDFFPVNEDTYLFYILGTNNGVAAFTNDENFALTQLDTLFYGDTPVLHMNPFGDGYIVGTNGYGDIGKYQRFDFKADDELYGFRFYFAVSEIVNTPDTLHMVVKSVAVDGSPDELLAHVMTTTDMLDVTMVGNTFFLPAPLKVTGPVFIGFEWSTSADDAFALYADANGEGEGANRAWERFSDGSYNDFGTTLNPTFSWDVDVDLWIAAYYRAAIVDNLEDDLAGLIPLKYSLSQNYPNPFNPLTKFQLAMPKTADVTITVYNAIGQKVKDVYHGNLTAGVHIFEFDGARFASGVYFYRVQSKEFTSVKKMVLVK